MFFFGRNIFLKNFIKISLKIKFSAIFYFLQTTILQTILGSVNANYMLF